MENKEVTRTSFIVSVVIVDVLNFRVAGPFGGDITPLTPLVTAFTLLNGAVKSSLNVIKWFDVMTRVHPSVLCLSCISNN